MYYVRADGNARIGAGHLMRCLTIAEELAKTLEGKEEIVFWCADEASASLAGEKGFSVEVLGTDYRNMEEELPILQEKFARLQDADTPHTILVDSYYVTDGYLEGLRAFGEVFLLDDMQQHTYPVDGVINYNAFAREEVYRRLYRQTGTQLLIGSRFVPVRQQFLQREYIVSKEVRDILITTGGGDVDNIAGAILEAVYEEACCYHVVVGKYNPHFQELTQMSQQRKGITLYHDVQDMAGLMGQCDLAITAGGTTIYELAAIGVPFLCFSYAENQEALTEYIGTREIAGFAGAYHKDREAVLSEMKRLVREYCGSQEKRDTCFTRERQLIDGLGARRLAESLAGNHRKSIAVQNRESIHE